ncbi:Efflux pump roqT [Colletotrichum trifolii]|uniref:Efflux pump roqT n=1 Tax=Colletotrichum trifolii TaxID=5466 RepID=A0A4R8R052_COLTR|nr:Efflux pump roqT [Colletotrichum trifolii]
MNLGKKEVIRDTTKEINPDSERGGSTQEVVVEEARRTDLVVAFLTVGLCLVLFATAVDNTILATAIPRITDDFDSLEDAGWYRSSYLVASTALSPSFGKVYANYSVKWTYLAGLVIFEAGSVLCALAPTSSALIAGRTVAGIGGAALYSGAINIIGIAAPMNLRPVLFAVISSMFGVASLVGPPLGGVFTDSAKLTWRWCFWINLPLGSVAFAVILFFFRVPPTTEERSSDEAISDDEDRRKIDIIKRNVAKMDPVGTVLLIPAIVSFLLALQWGGTKYNWRDGRVWGNLVCFGCLTIAFIASQVVAGDNATIPGRVFKQRAVWGNALVMTFLSAAMFTHIFYFPFYFQIVLGTTATGSGLRTLAYIGSVALTGVIVGAVMTRGGLHKPFAWAGAAIFVAGSGFLQTLRVDSGPAMFVGFQLMTGFGVGAAWQVPFVALQRAKGLAGKPGDMAVANALMAFFNSLGAALGISVAENVFASTLHRQLGSIAGLQPSLANTIANTGDAANLRNPAFLQPELLPPVLLAFNSAIMTTFIVAIASGGLAFLSSLI